MPTEQTTEQNKVNMSRLIVDLLGKGDLSVVDELAVPDFIEHSGPPGLPQGSAGAKAMAQTIRAGFPDYHVEVEDAIAQGDRVTLRLMVGGTHQGTLFSIPPTGKRAHWSEIHIMRVEEGKMVEHWFVADIMSMMHQLGLMTSDRR